MYSIYAITNDILTHTLSESVGEPAAKKPVGSKGELHCISAARDFAFAGLEKIRAAWNAAHLMARRAVVRSAHVESEKSNNQYLIKTTVCIY
jgi:hypothetical protein